MNSALPEKIRTFVGIFPPRTVAEALNDVAQEAQKDISSDALAWTRVEQIHLTLNFLGNIPSTRVEEFVMALMGVANHTAAFSLLCQGLGCFPNARKPKVLWAGLEGELESVHRLKSLLDEALAKLGIMPEKRAFHPHLTLGRVKKLNRREQQRLETRLKESDGKVFGTWRVETICFVRSELSSQGSNYTVLKSFRLGA